MSRSQILRLILSALGWIASRYNWKRLRVPVQCRTCPHWIYHSRILVPLSALADASGKNEPSRVLSHDAGACALQEPRIFNDASIGYALKVMTGEDWCSKHPLYDAKLAQNSVFEFKPDDPRFQVSGGFSAFGQAGMPTFAEAMKFARGLDAKPGDPVPDAPAGTKPAPAAESPAEATGEPLVTRRTVEFLPGYEKRASADPLAPPPPLNDNTQSKGNG